MSIWRQIQAGTLAVAAGLTPLWAGKLSQQASALLQTAATTDDRLTIVRELDDPACGTRWFLVPAPRQTPGPRRWLSGPAEAATAQMLRGPNKAGVPPVLVIRAGDPIQIEEHTAMVDATLEAVAMGNAATGAALRARLKSGGRVVRAIALGQGRAQLAPEEKRP